MKKYQVYLLLTPLWFIVMYLSEMIKDYHSVTMCAGFIMIYFGINSIYYKIKNV